MNNHKPKLTFLSGIPACGKSTFGKKLATDSGSLLLSSDSMRLELYGDENDQNHNPEVFDEIFKRMRSTLASGKDVIIDATNISAKKRVSALQGLSKQIHKKIIYFSTHFDVCVYRDSHRDRVVGKDVIDRMYRSFQIPTYAEGWDSIEFADEFCKGIRGFLRSEYEDSISNYTHHDELFEIFNQYSVFSDIYNLPHDSKWHSLSVSRHTYHVWGYALSIYQGADKLEMLWAALFHDVGKKHCKEFKRGSRYANFIGHECVSAQLAFNFLYSLGYDDDFILRVVELVQMHMRLLGIEMGENGEKGIAKLKSSLTSLAVYDKLVFLREADLQAH